MENHKKIKKILTMQELYNSIHTIGKRYDPRGSRVLRKVLADRKEAYTKLPVCQQKVFDRATLKSPYSDSRIINGCSKELKSLVVGIDIDESELLLIDKLREKGIKIDAVLAHHPVGAALAHMYEVGEMMADIFIEMGIPVSVAEKAVEDYQLEDKEFFEGDNLYKVPNTARKLEIPLLNAHTPADNCVTHYLKKFFAKRRVRNIFIDMTGAITAPKEIFEELSAVNIDTVVCMHTDREAKDAMESAGLNTILAGHMSSDSLGMNILLDKLENIFGNISILETAGFIRVSRNTRR